MSTFPDPSVTGVIPADSGGVVHAHAHAHVQWPAIFAGAVAAAGVSFTLHAFASGIGLSLLSTEPTAREASPALWFVCGLYVLFVALSAFGVGGYIAGRLRAPLSLSIKEMEFRDGMHGLIAWALAIVFTALLALGAAATVSGTAASGNDRASASAGEAVLALELDELFRDDDISEDALAYRRAEAARILLKAGSTDGVPDRDRAYLSVVAARVTGDTVEEAGARVDRVIEESAKALHRARVVAVLQAFFIGVALFVGLAVAWFSAVEGGRDRERGEYPIWNWSFWERKRD